MPETEEPLCNQLQGFTVPYVDLTWPGVHRTLKGFTVPSRLLEKGTVSQQPPATCAAPVRTYTGRVMGASMP